MENILYIVWNDKYNIGVLIIDEQHRGIVTTINSLHHFVKDGLGAQALQPTLTILEQYINIHFKTEEKLMEEANYPALKEHIQMHEDLARKTEKITMDSISSDDPDVVLKFLRNWWLGHIVNEDKKYGPYVLKLLKNR